MTRTNKKTHVNIQMDIHLQLGVPEWVGMKIKFKLKKIRKDVTKGLTRYTEYQNIRQILRTKVHLYTTQAHIRKKQPKK